jgi:hypothetical protein
VLAFLALCVALGGTGYAAVKINGADLVNSSVTGKKLKRSTIGAREVNESKLGTVPSAANATRANSAATAESAATAASATTAGSATNAGHATSADRATSAGFASRAGEATKAETATDATNATNATRAANATQADNAALLDGSGPQEFLSADTIASGIGAMAGMNQIFAVPDMGFAVTALPTDGDPNFEVAVRNTRAPGGANIALGLSTSNVSNTVPPGGSWEIDSVNNVFPPFLVADTAGTQPGVLVICGAHGTTAKVYCYGVRA